MNANPTQRLLAGVLLALAALTGGCSSGSTNSAGSTTASGAPASPAASPSSGPSAAARLVCSAEAAEDIEGALGAATTGPPQATWADHTYSCPYTYASGTMLMSVKELPDTAAVAAYFSAAQVAAGRSTVLQGMGEAAFGVADGSVYVRKDLTVLHVDVSKLPAHFGKPTRTRTQVGKTVATTILICWKEQ